jgi:hypothetical protein
MLAWLLYSTLPCDSGFPGFLKIVVVEARIFSDTELFSTKKKFPDKVVNGK